VGESFSSLGLIYRRVTATVNLFPLSGCVLSQMAHCLVKHIRLNSAYSTGFIRYSAEASVVISFFSVLYLCFLGTTFASFFLCCREYHRYHFAPYAFTLVYAIRIRLG
jgi:hypothetical protein